MCVIISLLRLACHVTEDNVIWNVYLLVTVTEGFLNNNMYNNCTYNEVSIFIYFTFITEYIRKRTELLTHLTQMCRYNLMILKLLFFSVRLICKFERCVKGGDNILTEKKFIHLVCFKKSCHCKGKIMFRNVCKFKNLCKYT